MKIGLILPLIYASPALTQGRIFAPRDLLSDLSNGLVARGHDVTVFSSSDFPTQARIIGTPLDLLTKLPDYYKFRNLSSAYQEWIKTEFSKHDFELQTVINAFQSAKSENFDLLHCYHDSSMFFTHYIADLISTPVVYTLHDPLPPKGSYEHVEFSKFLHHRYISISDSQRHSDLTLDFVSTIYHGIDTRTWTFSERDHGYLLFMGRLVPEKGLHTAIKVALEVQMPLEIGTNFPQQFEGDEYFQTKIKPFLDNPLIHEPGFGTGEKKILLYKDAKALLFPIEWEEPFGMVMIEAMACGTPVIAYNRGSVSEIVKDGVTGFIIDSGEREKGKGKSQKWVIKKTGMAGLIEAVQRIGEIDRNARRTHVENNFSVEKMVNAHERVYQQIVDKAQQPKEIIYEGSSHRV